MNIKMKMKRMTTVVRKRDMESNKMMKRRRIKKKTKRRMEF